MSEALATPKVIQDSIDWSYKKHDDYATCALAVFAPQKPAFRLRLVLTAHIRRLPRKCAFALILGERIFALDVNPGMIHSNRNGSGKVACTHWTTWPCQIVEPDSRDLIHVQWWVKFLERANISFFGKYERPPYVPEQMDLM